MSVSVDLAAAVEQKVLHPALGRAHAAPVIAALADAAGWRHTEPGRQGSQDPLTLAHIARLVVLPGYLQDRGVIGGILAQMPVGEQRFLGRLARAHHGATRTEDVDAARGRLLRALDEMGRACRAASRDAEAHAETAWRMRAAIQDVEAFKGTAGQLHQAQRVLTSSSEHEGRPSRMILWISGMPIEVRFGMLPGHLVLTPLDDLAASPRVENRGLAELMALTVPPTGEPTAAQIEKHFQRVADSLEPLHVRELTDRETLGSINAAVQRLYRRIRSEQPPEASADTWANAAFDRQCTELASLLQAPLEPVSDSSVDIDNLRRTESCLGLRANESYWDHLTAPESNGPPDPMIQNVVAHLKASVALVAALTDPQRPASAAKTVMAALYGATGTLPTPERPDTRAAAMTTRSIHAGAEPRIHARANPPQPGAQVTRSRTLLTLRQLGTRARISPQRVKVLHTIGVTPRPDARDGEGRPLYTPSTAEAWISAARRGNGRQPSWWLHAPNRPLTTLAALVLPVTVRQHARECLVTAWGAGESDPLAVVVYHDRLLPTWAIEDGLTALEAEVAARYPGYRADAAVWASVTVEEWSAQDATWREMTPRTPSGAPIICAYARAAAPAPRVRRLLAKAPDDVRTSPITSGDLADVLGRPVPLWPLHAFEPARAAEALQRGALPYLAEYDPQSIRSMAEALEILEHERSQAEEGEWRACLTRLAGHLAEQIEGWRHSYPPFPVTPRLNAGFDRPDDDLTSAVILAFPKLTSRQDELVYSHTSTGARTKDAFDQHRRDLDALRTARIFLNDAQLTGSDELHAAVEYAYGRLALAVGNFYPQVRGSDHRPCMTRVLRCEPAPGSLLARYLATVRWHEPGPDGPEPRRARAWHTLIGTAEPRTVTLGGIDTAGNLLARTTEPGGTEEIVIQWPIGHWSEAAAAPDEASFIGARHGGAGWLFIQHPDGPLAPLPLAPGSASADFAWGPEHRTSPAAASIAFAVDNWQHPEPASLSSWLDDRLAEADHDRYFALSVREVREHYAASADEH